MICVPVPRDPAGTKMPQDAGASIPSSDDAITEQVPLQPAALAVVGRTEGQALVDLRHGQVAQLRGGAVVQPPPDGLEAVAQQVVGAVARYERDVESVGGIFAR